MLLVTRSQWGARPPENRTPLERAAQHGTAVHYSAADADEQADHGNCAGRVRGIQNFHLDGRGWSDIAYSYLACKHGYVFEGRGRGIRTAANGTTAGNASYHAVCFLGDDTQARDDVTDAGRKAIRAAVDYCNGWAGVSAVRPHSWFKSTACPGDQLRGWLEAGMPVTATEEDDMYDADAEKRLFARIEEAERRTARYVDHGNADATGSDDHHERIRADLAGLRALLERGVTVNLNLADATPDQVLTLGKAIAEHLQIQGHPALTGTGTMQIALEAGPPA